MTSLPDAATLAVRAALESDTQHGAVVPPLHLSSNYTFAGYGEKRRYDYCRSGNPTRDALAEALTALEGGAGCTVTSSGMAALTLLVHLLEPGDRQQADPGAAKLLRRRRGIIGEGGFAHDRKPGLGERPAERLHRLGRIAAACRVHHQPDLLRFHPPDSVRTGGAFPPHMRPVSTSQAAAAFIALYPK